VNVSAPADNVLGSLIPLAGSGCGPVNLTAGRRIGAGDGGGSRGRLQVARLTGHPFPAGPCAEVLANTGTPVPIVPQSSVSNSVGPQINVRRAVEKLLQQAGLTVSPSVARVAIEQRRNFSLFDAAFLTATDPTNINLQGPVSRLTAPTRIATRRPGSRSPRIGKGAADAQFALS